MCIRDRLITNTEALYRYIAHAYNPFAIALFIPSFIHFNLYFVVSKYPNWLDWATGNVKENM